MEPAPAALRSITHDIRNLLTAIRGHAELALRGLPPEDPAREDVAHVVVVTAAVFDLLDQLDGADRVGTHVPVSLDASVQSMRRLLDALLPDSLEMEVATDAEGAYVAIPRLRIERIVLNLALNARDAMVDGGKLTVRTARSTVGHAQIIVSDTGPGFAAEALAHLFEDGFTTKRHRGGSGHGLHALSTFVAAAGGSIDVASMSGQGATVTVSLPLIDLTAAASDQADGGRPPVAVVPGRPDDEAPTDHPATADDEAPTAEAEPPADDDEPPADDAEPPADAAEPPPDDAEPPADEAEPPAPDQAPTDGEPTGPAAEAEPPAPDQAPTDDEPTAPAEARTG